jgi:hypothetical protein
MQFTYNSMAQRATAFRDGDVPLRMPPLPTAGRKQTRASASRTSRLRSKDAW